MKVHLTRLIKPYRPLALSELAKLTTGALILCCAIPLAFYAQVGVNTGNIPMGCRKSITSCFNFRYRMRVGLKHQCNRIHFHDQKICGNFSGSASCKTEYASSKRSSAFGFE